MSLVSDLRLRVKENLRRRRTASTAADTRVAPGAPKLAPVFSRTMEEALSELTGIGSGNVLVCGDASMSMAVSDGLAAMGKSNPVALFDDSITPDGTEKKILHGANFAETAAIVVGGKGLNTAWPQILRQLYQKGVTLPPFPVLWVGEGFEWCLGSLAFPENAVDADVFLFHHWATYAGMKDHILAQIRVFDEHQEKIWTRIMAPSETIRLQLNEILPDRQGTTGIRVETYHPKLIGRRNHRWRPFADVYSERSLTSLHGTHEPPKPKRVSQFIVDVVRGSADRLVVTLPNYYHDLPDTTEDVAFKLCDPGGITLSEASQDRKVSQTISSLTVDMASAPADATQCRIKYRGAGGSFWYNQKNYSGIDCLAANHTVSSPYEIVEATRGKGDPEIDQLEKQGVIIWPYPVPVTPEDSPIEFGFNFLCSQPEFHHYRGIMIDGSGESIGALTFNHSGQSHCMVSDMLASAPPEDKARTKMVIVIPDWAAEGRRPDQVRIDGLMIAKCRATGDYDNTEFQNSWRNVGAKVPRYRHWLFDNMMLTGRTNLKGRFNQRPDIRNGIMLINSSGRLDYDTSARVTVQVVAANGFTIGKPVTVGPHGYQLVWLEDLFPGLREILGGQEATVLAHSSDADCNGHMVTLRNDEAVSLQHMWGY